MKRDKLGILAAIGIVLVGGLLTIGSGTTTAHDRELSEERMEFIEFDTNNPRAMADWARGVCRSQRREVLATFFHVEDTPEAVAAAIARDLPDQARKIVIKVCESELRRPRDQ